MCAGGGHKPFSREMMAEVVKRHAAMQAAQDKMRRGPDQTTAQRGPLIPKYQIVRAQRRDVAMAG